MDTQQTPALLAAAETAGFLSTWTLAAIASLVAAPRASVAATGVLAALFKVVFHVSPAQARALCAPLGERCGGYHGAAAPAWVLPGRPRGRS